MKTMLSLGILLSLATISCLGDEPKGGQVLVESQAIKKEEKKVPVTPPKPSGEILGKKVEYGGYLTDLSRAENKRAFFNLKAPLDPRKDLENLSFYPGTEKVQGVILFSIKF